MKESIPYVAKLALLNAVVLSFSLVLFNSGLLWEEKVPSSLVFLIRLVIVVNTFLAVRLVIGSQGKNVKELATTCPQDCQIKGLLYQQEN